MRGWKRFPAAIKCIMHNGGEIVMKTKEKKEKAIEEEKNTKEYQDKHILQQLQLMLEIMQVVY